jgi:SAM-dependent methyltransferase
MDAARAGEIRDEVRTKYRDVAERPEGQFGYPIGRASAERLGYEAAWLDAVPAEVVDRFVGVGNPFTVHRPAAGDRVLDVGCGCGLDVFVAAQLVGPRGRAVGIDLTNEMLAWPRRLAADWPHGDATFAAGSVESLDFDDASFDAVISNGALNLVPDKDAALREIHRVLRPGGTFAVADLLVTEAIPDEVLAGVDAWST